MSGKGFGEPRQSETDKLIKRIVRYCRQRSPESLDRIMVVGMLGFFHFDRIIVTFDEGSMSQMPNICTKSLAPSWV
ncbi:hypothetical protein [Moorena sp. SIO4G3]|uniref:hypothetical protein n=1 Tax=Moorena sp. SIO4G3 TaxID=2607821 RepID=UPI00142ACA7F|nr:hypothetical protein [Moorena sp. SIO4G3]NEO80554.1 hypothetical protein [Moorena sp. SIO4G3]